MVVVIFYAHFSKKIFNHQGKKFVHGCTRMAIVGRRLCSIIRELNPASCDPYMGPYAVKATFDSGVTAVKFVTLVVSETEPE
jgi:hypothetical protein